MENLVNPWQGKRVFMTGHTGFKGGWLSIWLARHGAHVRGYALDPMTEPNFFSVASVSSVVEDVRGDIRDFGRLESSMVEFRPDVVFHLAAQPLVRASYADPLGTYGTNVMGTAHVLEAVRKTPSVRAAVCITTDKCYRNDGEHRPYTETDPLGGHDPYSSSKACAEIVTAAYRSSFFSTDSIQGYPVAVATARAGNVIGGGDWAEDRLVPDLMRAFLEKRPVTVRNPRATRPWQHVLDPLSGYMLLAERLLDGRLEFASAYNFGPAGDELWTVERITTKLAHLWGNGACWVRDTAPVLHEAEFLALDSSKSRTELGWQALLKIEVALEWTMSWYKLWQQGAEMRQVTEMQIAAYEALLPGASRDMPEEVPSGNSNRL
jgi:CDP-glucose 4,6-dehydratase